MRKIALAVGGQGRGGESLLVKLFTVFVFVYVWKDREKKPLLYSSSTYIIELKL